VRGTLHWTSQGTAHSVPFAVTVRLSREQPGNLADHLQEAGALPQLGMNTLSLIGTPGRLPDVTLSQGAMLPPKEALEVPLQLLSAQCGTYDLVLELVDVRDRIVAREALVVETFTMPRRVPAFGRDLSPRIGDR
jgi:hypothetical protein